MMNSYQRNRGLLLQRAGVGRSMGKFVVSILVVSAVTLIDIYQGGLVRNSVRPLFAPVANFARASITSVSAGDFWSTRSALIKENAELRIERDKFIAESAGYNALRIQNEALARTARLADVESKDGIPVGMTARVMSSLHASPYGTFIIGAGAAQGVKTGNIVQSDGGFVIGVVSDTSNSSSLVRMVFAPGEKTEAVSGSTGFSISGRGGGNAFAKVPREAPLNEQDAVFAPHLGNRAVGIIGKIESATSSAYADVYIILPQNLNTVQYVYVIPGL